jgi:hypothetical protein
VLKRAVNVLLHALRSHKQDQFGGLLHKMEVVHNDHGKTA